MARGMAVLVILAGALWAAAGAQTPALASGAPPGATTGAQPAGPGSEVADHPVRIYSERLGIDHRIEARGVVDGHMEEPHDGVRGVAWYWEFGTPGPGGNSMYSAHETWSRQRGPFYWLHQAEVGDEIWVQMSSGGWWLYTVFRRDRYYSDTIPMGELLAPSDLPDEEEWITLLTCGGSYVRLPNGYWEYLQRDVVVAKRYRYVQ